MNLQYLKQLQDRCAAGDTTAHDELWKIAESNVARQRRIEKIALVIFYAIEALFFSVLALAFVFAAFVLFGKH